MFSMVTVASSTRMPTASARPPSVMMLMVSRSRPSRVIEVRIEKRNRNGDDHRAAPAAQEDQDHEAGEAGRNNRLANHAAHGRSNKDRLIGQWLNFQLWRKRGLDPRKQLANAIDHIDGRSVTGFEHGDQCAAAAIVAHDIGLRGESIAYLRDVAQVDGCAIEILIGRSFNSATVRGLALRSTSYSNWPILAVPDGSTIFCRFTAETTSAVESPFDWRSCGFNATDTWRDFPP